MNNKFYQLESQKQMDIINAGIEYFARFEYKKASTEDIAKSAGISNRLKLNGKVELNDIMKKYKGWTKVLKKSAHKEEFL